MNQVGGSTIVARCLKKEGVDTIFTLPGGHTMGLYYACNEAGIEVVDCRSEAAVVSAAIGYARVTGKPGVLVTTAGPGVTNTVTGMMEALTSRTPIIHIGGAAPLVEEGAGALQDVDTLTVMRSCSKWVGKVSHTHRIADRLDTAFRQAVSGLPGPAYLEIACDILLGTTREDVTYSMPRTDAIPCGHPEDIRRAARLLAGAKAPVMVIGNFALYSAQEGEYIGKLAEYLSMPVRCGAIVRGVFVDEDDRLARLGTVAGATADVVLTLGVYNDCAFGKLQPPAFAADAKFIQVNTDASLIGYNQNAHVGIVGGCGVVARQLYEALQTMDPPCSDVSRFEALEEQVRRNDAHDEQVALAPCPEAGKIRPGRCAWETAKFLDTEEGRQYQVISDGGDGGSWINMLAKAHRDRRVMGLVGNGTIGLAPGVTVGAWFGNRKKTMIYTGDGSFGFSCMEFHNFVKYNMPIVIVVSNDSAWGMVKGFEYIIRPEVYLSFEDKYQDKLAVNLQFVHYEKLAEMFGGYGELVEDAEEIIPAIRRGIASGKPAIINVRVEDICKDGYSRSTRGMADTFKPYCRDF